MENIYEWLFENYFLPHMEKIINSYTDMKPFAEESERILLMAEGGLLERQDALHTQRMVVGTAAFAAGVYFGTHLIKDADFISSIRGLVTVIG